MVKYISSNFDEVTDVIINTCVIYHFELYFDMNSSYQK